MNWIILPWPNRLLSPNTRTHHMVRSRATRSYRAIANYLGSENRRKRLRDPALGVLPIVPTRRRRDIDNVLASLKSALDGLTDNGWWDDDSSMESITIRRTVVVRGHDPSVLIIATDGCNSHLVVPILIRFSELAAAGGIDAAKEVLNG